MLYKPNFCCNCGEKIEKADWNLLTSRRFCDVCSAENKLHDNIPRAAVAGGLLMMMFGLGTFFGGRTNGSPTVQAPTAAPAALKFADAAPRSGPEGQTTLPPPQASEPKPNAPKQKETGQTSEKVYYCGALTKKGTPCSRKVKSPGSRCYQHEGKPAAAAEP